MQAFLEGGGEMGELTRNYNWSETSLGTPDNWPQSLRTTLGILLHSSFPMFLFWSSDLICFYNDAFRPSFGIEGKHPCLGKKGPEVWPEIWDFIGPMIGEVMSSGKSFWFENQLVPFYRNGRIENIYWTFSYSPVYGDNGGVSGVFVTCTETTATVNSIKDIKESKDLLEFATEAADLATWDLDVATNRFTSNARLKEWFGLQPDEEIALSLATAVIAKRDRQRVIDEIARVLRKGSGGLYDIEYTIVHPHTGRERTVIAKGKARFNEEGDAYRFNGILTDVTKERDAQKHIAEARQLAELAIKSSGIGLFEFDLKDLKTAKYSPTFAYIFTGDETRKDLTRELFINRVHPEDEPLRKAAIISLMETGSINYTPRAIWDDGSIHRIHVVAGAVRDSEGKITGISGTVKDITAQEEQEAALKKANERLLEAQRKSDALLRNIADSSPTGLWLSDEHGRLSFLNKTLVEWTGMDYEDILGNGWMNAIIEADRPQNSAAFLKAVVTQTHYDMLFRIKKRDETIVWCRSAGDPFYKEDGSYGGHAGYCLDIDELVNGREALQQSEQKFRSLIEQAPVATCLFVGYDMTIEVANELMIGYWGKDSSVVGKPLLKAVPELADQQFIEILRQVFITGKTHQATAAFVRLQQNGAMRDCHFDYTYKPLLNAEGEVYGIMNMAVDVTAQVIAQQKIEESQQQILTSFEQSPVALAIISKDALTFRMVNSFYGTLVGRTPEEIIDKPLLEALPELRGQGFDRLLQQVIESGNPYTANEVPVNILRGQELETIFVDLTYQPRRDADNTISGILVVATEVTQQVIARKKIELSEAKLRSVIASAPAGMALFAGRDLIIENPNQTFIDILGKGADIAGKTLREVMPELITEGQPFLNILDEVFTTGVMFQSFGAQVKILKQGVMTDNYYNITYTPLFNNEGEVYAILDIAIDVTGEIKARQKLEDAEATLSGAIELAELATWRMNILQGTFHYSKRFMDWLGFSEDTKTIDEAYNPLPDEFKESVPLAIKAAIKPGSSGKYEYEHPIINRLTGQIRIIHAQAQVFYDEHGLPTFLTGTAQDITEQRGIRLLLEQQVQERTEELASTNEELQAINEELAVSNTRLIHSNEELAQYAYVASHDLQEPLRKIRMFSDMLEKQPDQKGEHSTLIRKIVQSAERMSLLIQDLLNFSRLLHSESLIQPVVLSAIVEAVVGDFELIIQEKHAHVTIGELPVIEGVALQMNQLFYNLIGNALKFSKPDVLPVIEISSKMISHEAAGQYIAKPSARAHYYQIMVKDNGIGFDAKYAEQIFEVFKRLHGRDIYPGSGIGLALCRRIVGNLSGMLFATSIQGSGSVFSIILPDRQVEEKDTSY